MISPCLVRTSLEVVWLQAGPVGLDELFVIRRYRSKLAVGTMLGVKRNFVNYCFTRKYPKLLFVGEGGGNHIWL